jgi:hypothetical protein
MSANQIFAKLEALDSEEAFESHWNINCLRSVLSQMVKRGALRIDGLVACPGCGRGHNSFRITDDGRIYLREKEEQPA